MRISLFLLLLFCSAFANATSIYGARRMSAGSTVTVSGVALNGAEFLNQRFLDDGTAGICIFSSQLAAVNKGDHITVQGTIDIYHNLVEVINLTLMNVNSTGNALPAAAVLFPHQLKEAYEGQLVQLRNAWIINAAGTFAGNSQYSITDGSSITTLFVKTGTNLVGQPVPTGRINITGICTQYDFEYELIPRTITDITNASLYIDSMPAISSITTTGFDVNWSVNVNASAAIRYGHTPLLELGQLNGNISSTVQQVIVNGNSPAEIYYFQAMSINGNDTAFSPVMMAITAAASSSVNVYFNRSVNTSVASPPSNLAISLPNSFDDTIADYINNAQQSVDVAIYSFTDNGTAAIISAINNAFTSGKQVRVIYDGNSTLTGIQQLNPSIPMVSTPPDDGLYNIMHNKFVIADAATANAVVITGSTNFSDGQLYDDANNLLVIRDQSMAKNYTLEFEEMWGSTGALPDAANSRFGYYKKDNTAHTLSLGGNKTESYFSPSDNVNTAIGTAINTADNSLYFALMLFTKTELANAIVQRINNGVFSAGILNDTSGTSGVLVYNALSAAGNDPQIYDWQSLPGILHHKYMIVDQNTFSDPLVLTGSHNWTLTAETRNDENTLVLHNALIANQYFQEFWKRMQDNGVTLDVKNIDSKTFHAFPVPADDHLTIQYNGRKTSATVVNLFGQEIDRLLINENTLINTSGYPDGIYFLKPEEGQAVRFVVQH